MQKYNKAIVAVVGIAVTLLAPHFGANANFQYVVGVATALGIYHVPNLESYEVVAKDIETAATDVSKAVG